MEVLYYRLKLIKLNTVTKNIIVGTLAFFHTFSDLFVLIYKQIKNFKIKMYGNHVQVPLKSTSCDLYNAYI